MFSPKIVSSDAFLDMPTSSRELYFQLGMYADDDGFVNPKRIVRMLGASEDDLKVLIGKRFVLPFDNGVVVIKHWAINNLIRKDWYQETIYVEEKKRLKIKENGSYTELVTEFGNISATEVRLGKVRLGKDIDTSGKKEFSTFWGEYPKKVERKKSEEKWNRLSLEDQESILKDIPLRKKGKQWTAGYIPNPLTYLNGERWNDEIETTKINSITIQ